jgi:HD-GYP domain-containing protein (c-di-GMP phosphodiesterase class II)
VVRAHHERWDGRGYPDGLKKEQIPYLARIISIADVYDALTSDRSYRSKMSQDKALAILSESAGSQFDPEISKVFIDLLHQRTMDLNHGPPETGFGPDAPGEAVSAP